MGYGGMITMFREYIKELIKEEILKEKDEIKDIQLDLLKIHRELSKIEESIDSINNQFDDHWNKMYDLKEDTEKSIAQMVHDTIIKLESYEEAALAVVRNK